MDDLAKIVGGDEENVRTFVAAFVTIFGRQPTPVLLRGLLGISSERTIELSASSTPDVIRLRGSVADSIGPTQIVEQRFFLLNGDLVAHLDLVWLQEGATPGTGSKILLRQLEAFLATGVAEISLEAAGVGQHFWARVGFELRHPSEMQTVRLLLAAWLYKFRDFEDLEQARRVASRVRSLAEIASSPVGKDFLVWAGHHQSYPAFEMVLSLRDPESATIRNVREYLAQERSSSE